MLPFTHDQFLAVFAQYNEAVWPAQLLAYALAAAVVVALSRRSWPAGGCFVAGALAWMWVWTGAAYHWLYFSTINAAAWVFGAMFVLQGLLLAHAAATRGLGLTGTVPPAARWLGWGLVLYATVLYPLIGMLAGPGYPRMPTFGITPCPVTLFTFGVLLLAGQPVPRWLLVVPVLWSLIGGSAAVLLQVPQDWVLLLSGPSIFFMARRVRGPGTGRRLAL